MGTKHMNAEIGDFAETVLMPGDPLRAQYIAETFLKDVKRVTDVRNMFGFTGRYKDQSLSIMAHGMGIPSASIYCSELIEHYGVKQIIRVGSCGTVSPHVNLRDIIIGLGASTDSKVNRIRFGGHDLAAIASFNLASRAVEVAKELKVPYHVGGLFSADLFYTPEPEIFDLMAKYNILGVEMEAAGIYALAAEHSIDALAICTVSDDIRSGEALSSKERQTTFDQMIEVALETAHVSKT
jgi:purine-nucleoside phosphorylase